MPLRKYQKRLLSVVVLLAVLAFSALLFIRSRADEWLKTKIIASLESRYEMEVEIGHVHLDWRRRKLDLEGVVLRNRLFASNEPFFRADRLSLEFEYLDLYPLTFRSIRLDDIYVLKPEFWIQRDPNGKINLSNIFITQRKSEFTVFDLAIGHIALSKGIVHYLDHDFPLESDGKNLEIAIKFNSHRRAYEGSIEMKDSEVGLRDLRMKSARGRLRFDYLENALNFPEINFRSDLVDMDAEGGLGDLREFRYRFTIKSTVRSEKLPASYTRGLDPVGTVGVSAVWEGTHENFSLRGSVAAPRLRLYRVHLRDVSAPLDVTARIVKLRPAQGVAFSGRFRADLQVAVHPSDSSTLDAQISGADLQQVLQRFPILHVQADATGRGSGKWHWRGTDFGRAQGDGTAALEGTLLPAGESKPLTAGPLDAPLPFSSRFEFKQAGTSLMVANGLLETSRSQVRFTGRAAFGGSYSFDARLTTVDSGEIVRAASALGLLASDTIEKAALTLGGRSDFNGTLTGNRGQFQIRGRGHTETVQMRGIDLGRFAGNIDYAAGTLHLSDAVLQRNGSSVHFDLRMPIRNLESLPAGVAVKASVRNGQIEDFLKAVSLSYPVSGILNGQLDFEVLSQDNLRGSGEVEITRPRYLDERADQLRANFVFDGSTLRTTDLSLRKESGVLSGDFAYNLRSGSGEVDLTGRNYPLGALPQQPLKGPELAGTVEHFRLKGSGTLQDPRFTLEAQIPRLIVRDQELERVVVTARGENRPIRFNLDYGFRGNRFHSEGTLQTSPGYQLQASLNLNSLPIEPYLALLPIDRVPSITGTVSGKLDLRGSLQNLRQLQAVGRLTEVKLRFENIPVQNSGPVVIEYDGSVVRLVERAVFVGPGTQLNVAGQFPLVEAGRLDVNLTGTANLAIVASLFPGASGSGQVELNTFLMGTFNQPRIVGRANIRRGFLHQAGLPTSVSNMEGTLRFTSQQIAIDNVTAKTAFGAVNIQGGIFLDGLAPSRWRINISGSGLRVSYPADVRAVLDVELDWLKSATAQLLTGSVYVRSAEYTKELDIADALIRYSTYKGLPPPTRLGSEQLVLDVDIEGYQSLRIDNNLADVVASADLNMRGTLDHPILLGRITADSGELRLQSTDYEVTRGSVSFSDPRKITPVVNLEAETDMREYTLMVTLRGPIERMTTSFRSDPPLPTADIVTMLALGRTREDIRAGGQVDESRTLGFYGASALLARGLSSRIQTRTSRLFGFDKFAIDPFLFERSDPTARVTVGKQINKNLSVTYSTKLSSTQDDVIVVEYALKDWATLVATRNEDGSFGLDLKLKKRF